MDRDTASEEEKNELPLVGLLDPLWSHRRLIVVTTLVTTVLAIVLSGMHYLWQPVRWMASLEFRATFEGANRGKYPNQLPFASSDVMDPSVLDQVFDTNTIQDFCSRQDFRSAFFVEQRSPELLLIDADYQSRLVDSRLTPVDRQRLQEEYRARRAGAPVQYALTFIRPAACRTMPAPVISKVLNDVLLTWANDSETKRGVLKQRIRVLTPNVLDVAMVEKQSLLVRANLVWTNIGRVIRNVTEFEALPGSEMVHVGEQQTSLAEIKAKLEDLQHSQLETLMISVGAERDKDAVRWFEEALTAATSEQQLAQDRARASLDALREYSGVVRQPSPQRGDGQNQQAGIGNQALAPQMDRTFLDRILDMSDASTTFRQEMTRDFVGASLEAVEFGSVVNHYKQLLAELKRGGSGASPADIEARLSEIVAAGKDLIRQFNGLTTEWSRVSFRAGPAMYRIESASPVEGVRPVTLARYAVVIAILFLVTLMVAVLAALAHTRVWPLIVARR